MRKTLLIAMLLQSCVLISFSQKSKPEVIVGKLERVSAPVSSYPSFTKPLPGIYKTEIVNEHNVEKLYNDKAVPKPDGALQSPSGTMNPTSPEDIFESTLLKNWEGMSVAPVSPPDPTLAVGPNHVVQMVNTNPGGSLLTIYNKTGTVLVNAVTTLNVHGVAGAGGDPIALYDKMADRWVLTEFTTTAPYKLVILVSKTNDPTGQYYVYSYAFGTSFPDYPKYSVWPNAYYASANIFPNAASPYSGSSILAFNKAKMLAGDPTAEMIRFDIGSTSVTKYYSTSPVTYQGGTAPAANAPGMFCYLNADENTTADPTDVDSIGIVTLSPNFATPASSSYTFKAFPAAAFNTIVGAGAPQPNTTSTLQTLDNRIMNQPVFRDFGTHQSIFVVHTVGVPAPTRAGLRWYELRNTGSGFTLYQQGTFAPDNAFRFMPSIATNKKGELAIAYMTSSSTVFPSLKFAGRAPTDPLGTLTTFEETTIINGNNSQTQNARSGDYTHLMVDPVDDTTFWYTGHYHHTPALFGGYTRVANFDLAEPFPWDARMVSVNTPTNNAAFCSTSITPNITWKNNGLNTITSLTLFARIDNGPAVSNVYTGSVPLGGTATLDLATQTTTAGTHTLTVYTSQPNGNLDQNLLNDTLRITFTVLSPQPGPIVEGFESATFPPVGWRVINTDGATTWSRTTAASKSGVASALIDFYNYSATGQLDYLVSPILDATDFDTVQLSFDRAYRKYNTSTTQFTDTLIIQISTDCGVTFPIEVWRKGGAQLATNPATLTGNYVPVAGDWLNEVVNLKPFLPAGTTSFSISMTGKNGFGQKLYLDNINIRVTKQVRRDASITRIIDPFTRLCSRNLTPLFEITNKGIDTLKTVKVNYTLNGGPVVTFNWTGALANGKSVTQAMPAITLPAAGVYTLKAYTSDPNGGTDQFVGNDTMTVVFTVFDAVPAPVKESFEQPTFPPANWAVASSNAKYTWERTTRAASDGVASTWMRNRVYNNKGATDDLYAPVVTVNNVDSVFLLFDVAHMPARFPGSTAVALDTLEVLITKDCGRTFTSLYKKWGEDLQSVRDPNFPGVYATNDTIAFVPNAKNQWRTDSLNITNIAGTTGQFQIVFRNTNNNGNNIFLDNINIKPVTVPAKLKAQGYMITPNPSEGWVYVQHYLRPGNLRGIQVVNSNGQMIWQAQYNGNALANIPVDLTRFAAGIYTFRLIYDNKVVTQRVVKIK